VFQYIDSGILLISRQAAGASKDGGDGAAAPVPWSSGRWRTERRQLGERARGGDCGAGLGWLSVRAIDCNCCRTDGPTEADDTCVAAAARRKCPAVHPRLCCGHSVPSACDAGVRRLAALLLLRGAAAVAANGGRRQCEASALIPRCWQAQPPAAQLTAPDGAVRLRMGCVCGAGAWPHPIASHAAPRANCSASGGAHPTAPVGGRHGWTSRRGQLKAVRQQQLARRTTETRSQGNERPEQRRGKLLL